MYSSAGGDAPAQMRRPVPMPSLSALKAGMPGAAAAACQTASFMWLSTTAAFQYRYGASLRQALQLLYAQGGVRRFYSGLAPTLMHVTLCRFGDTTANNIALSHAPTDSLPLNTLCASFAAGAWRATLLPLETFRSNMQVRGPEGFSLVIERFRRAGFGGLYRGSAASFSAGVVGHFPFFFTVNFVSQAVPLTEDASFLAKVGRNGGMGFMAAMSADIFTNGFKVLANNKQTCDKGLSYYEVARKIVKRDGVLSIVTRGLKTRMLSNGLQGATFVLVWKEIESRLVRTRFNSPAQS
ncbi:Mitochondrial carrier [Gracilaria domingensis]|nr:Mitochondrial carrier [Gracilaria domingensis]